MSRTLGTVVRGVRAPIFREGDNVVQITADTVLNALKDNGITARDGDIVAITESVVARCQGNYATVEQIAADVRAKTGGQTVGVTFPILSRNRFSLSLIHIYAEKEISDHHRKNDTGHQRPDPASGQASRNDCHRLHHHLRAGQGDRPGGRTG